MPRPPKANSPNVEKMFSVYEEMAALTKLWDSKPDRHLSIPFDTYGKAVNVRLLFHVWRKEASRMFPTDALVAIAGEILCRKPLEFEGRWYLHLVRRGDSDLAKFLRGQGAEVPALPERPPLPPTAPPPEPDEEEEGASAMKTAKDILSEFLGKEWK